jgi:excisionase family DNA binding protein
MSTTNVLPTRNGITRYTKAADLPEFLTVDETAIWLSSARSSVYAMVASGRLPVIRMGRVIRIRREDLIAFTTSRREP